MLTVCKDNHYLRNGHPGRTAISLCRPVFRPKALNLPLLNLEYLFLPFNFPLQFFFGRKICQVFRCKQLRILVENGVFCYVLARLGTENQSNRRIIPFSAP